MKGLLRFAAGVDRFHDRIGALVSWLVLLMILIGAFNTVVRYVGRFTGWHLSSNAYLELQWYLFSLVFLLGAAYALRRNAHVRVDVLYGRLSRRQQAWIDLLGSLLFLIPFSVFALWVSWPSIHNSWKIFEMSSDPGGLPRYPIKTVIYPAFLLLIAQGVSEAIKNLARLRGLEVDVGDEEAGGERGERV